MTAVLLRALAFWLLLVVVAILNAALREKLLGSRLGEAAALPLSGVLLALFIFLVTLLGIRFLRVASASECWAVGGLWLVLTVAFEFVFGHCAVGKSWGEVAQAFNVLQGNLMALALLSTLLSPYLAALLRGMI